MHITSTLSNLLGFTMEFIFDGLIPAQTGMMFTTKSFILPVYG
ncbi:MAG: hypothetical protein WCL02_07175 [bacterium]